MKILKPKFGGSIKAVVTSSDGFIILEEYSTKYIRGTSNLYKIDQDMNLIWEAKIANGYNAISNVFLDGNVLKVYDGSGEADLNPDTGELTNWVLTK